MCSVFAQLYTPDGTCHGLHNFVVPIRNIAALRPARLSSKYYERISRSVLSFSVVDQILYCRGKLPAEGIKALKI
jgi:hypothetical protein